MDKQITIADAARVLERSRSRVDQVVRELGIEPARFASVRFLTLEQFNQVKARILSPCKSGPKGPRKGCRNECDSSDSSQLLAHQDGMLVNSKR